MTAKKAWTPGVLIILKINHQIGGKNSYFCKFRNDQYTTTNTLSNIWPCDWKRLSNRLILNDALKYVDINKFTVHWHYIVAAVFEQLYCSLISNDCQLVFPYWLYWATFYFPQKVSEWWMTTVLLASVHFSSTMISDHNQSHYITRCTSGS